MKKALFIVPVVIIAGILGGGYFYAQKTASEVTVATEEFLKDLKVDLESTDEESTDEKSFTYGEVSTDALQQTTTIKDLNFSYETDLDSQTSSVVFNVGSVAIKRNFWDQDSEGNTLKAEVTFKDISMRQGAEYSDDVLAASGMGFLADLSDQLSTTEEATLLLEGFIPASGETIDETILAWLAHDQKMDLTVKNTVSDVFQKDLPFLALLSDADKSNLSQSPEMHAIYTYKVADNVLDIEVPKYGNEFFESLLSAKVDIDAAEAIEAQDLALIKVGKVHMDFDAHSMPTLKKLQFGDGAALGKHSIGGISLKGGLDLDLTEADFSGELDEWFELIASTLKYDYDLGFSDIDVDLNLSDDPQSHMGTYKLGGLNLDLNVDLASLAAMETNPMAMISMLSADLNLEELVATPPAGLSGMLMLMGLNQEQASAPAIHELSLNLVPEEGVYNLAQSGLKTNFGQLVLDGKLDTTMFNFDQVSVSLIDAPEAIVNMATQSLPEEMKAALKKEGSTYSLKINGSPITGLSYE